MAEQVVVTKASDTEVTLTTTTITEQKVALQTLMQQKAQFEAEKAQFITQIDTSISRLNKVIKDAEAQGVVEAKALEV